MSEPVGTIVIDGEEHAFYTQEGYERAAAYEQMKAEHAERVKVEREETLLANIAKVSGAGMDPETAYRQMTIGAAEYAAVSAAIDAGETAFEADMRIDAAHEAYSSALAAGAGEPGALVDAMDAAQIAARTALPGEAIAGMEAGMTEEELTRWRKAKISLEPTKGLLIGVAALIGLWLVSKK